MREVEDCGPPWLKQLLKTNFFDDCETHGDYKCNQCNHYCIDCTGDPLCSYCLDEHKNHQTIQIRRSSLSDAVRVDDIRRNINVQDIQTYKINRGQIIFLNSRPYGALPYGVTNVCNICHCSLPAADFNFCCLSCKRKAIYHGFPKQTFTVETKVGTCEVEESFKIDQSSTPKEKVKVRKLNKLPAKSSLAFASVAKQVTSNICPATAPLFNHVNSRKRKGIPQRAPLT